MKEKLVIGLMTMLLMGGIIAFSGCVDQSLVEEEDTTTLNDCAEENFGMPTFEGTPYEGHGCYDDVDCSNHPPTEYDDVGDLQCCIEDGTCYW